MFTRSLKTGLVKFLIKTLSLFSLKNCLRFGALLGWVSSVTSNRNRLVTEKNIQLCFPDMSKKQQHKLMQQSLIETGKTLTEASPMWNWDKNKLFKLIKYVSGEEHLQKALKNEQGVILALPHLGNWELLSLYCSAHYPITTMYKKPKISKISSLVKHGRERLGANLVPADNVGVRSMLTALKKKEFVAILPDQEPSKGNGVFSSFFGVPAYSMTLISRLAKKTNARVIMAHTVRLSSDNGYVVIFTDLPEMKSKIESNILNDSVNYLNAQLEKCIRGMPEQYQWSYKRFKLQPTANNEFKNGLDLYNS